MDIDLRLYALVDPAVAGDRRLVDLAGLIASSATLVQLRDKHGSTRAMVEEARALRGVLEPAGVPLLINDRVDVALAAEADGVHIGQDDLSPRDARKLLGPAPVIGFSSHNSRQLADACSQPVDYVAFGPVFPTASKQNPDPVAGMEALRQCRALCSKPLVAIGGITRSHARDVLAAGADSIALIADLLPAAATAQSLRERMEEWQQLVKPA